MTNAGRLSPSETAAMTEVEANALIYWFFVDQDALTIRFDEFARLLQ